MQSDAWKTKYEPPQPKEEPIQYLPMSVLEESLKHYDKNNLIRFLVKLFGKEKAFQLAELYKLGSSKRWTNNKGFSVVFWQVDSKGNVRQAKVMAYDPATGKRLKSDKRDFVSFMGKAILKNWDANFQQCLFGEHLINSNPDLPIALVESEKTAVIMAGISPKAIWMATGGKDGAKWTDKSVYGVFKDRQVILYPDLGAFNKWSEKAKILGTVCQYRVSDLLEQKATNDDRQEGFDIADYFIKEKSLLSQSDENELPAGWKRDENGVLIDADELPATWNLNPKNEGEKTAIIRELKFNRSIAKSL